MKTRSSIMMYQLIMALILVSMLQPLTAQTPVPGDENWDPRFATQGMGNIVAALCISGSNLYAGGAFTTAGTVPVSFIAKWNGSSWSPLYRSNGTYEGVNGHVTALAVSGNNLFVGGGFTDAGGVPANSIAVWDGSTWSNLGDGILYNQTSTQSALISIKLKMHSIKFATNFFHFYLLI